MFIKQSTAYTFRFGPFLDETDGKTAETGLTISQADIRLSKGGGNFAQKNESSASSHDEIGYYIVVLDATDTNTCGELLVACHESGALPVFKTFQVLEEHIYDALFAASAAAFDANQRVDVSKIEGSDATDQINAACDASIVTYNLDHLMHTAVASNANMTTEVPDGTVLSNIMTKTGDTSDYAYATDSLEALGEDADAILADTNELQTDWVNGGRLDLLLDSVITKIDTVDGIVDTILVDTNELQGDWANGGRLDLLLDSAISKIDVVDGIVDTILVDTNELQADWVNGGRLDLLLDSAISKIDVIDGIVDNILVDTAVIGSAGAGLTAIPWNSAWDAEVQSECTDALNAYDPPTKAELDSTWTTAQTEAYASDGAAATPAQLLYMIYCAVGEFAVSGTTITGKKLDGSTTAMTWTIDDASSPTSRTRAS